MTYERNESHEFPLFTNCIDTARECGKMKEFNQQQQQHKKKPFRNVAKSNEMNHVFYFPFFVRFVSC